MNTILTFTMLTLYTNGIYSKKIYLVKTNVTGEPETNEGMKDDTDDDNDEKSGADYAATPVPDHKEGSDVHLKCHAPVDFQDCQFKEPSGIIHKLGISGNAYKSGRVKNLHGVEKFNPKRLCAILINNLKKEDHGNWSCTLKFPSGSITSTQYVEVVPSRFTTEKFCPKNFKTLSTGCYRFEVSPVTWKEAKAKCSKWGANMAIVESEKEREAITYLTQELINKKERFWLNGKKVGGQWKTHQGTRLPEYAPWGTIEIGEQGSCLRSGPRTEWYTAPCNSKDIPGGYKLNALCRIRCPAPWKEFSTGCYWTTKAPMTYYEASSTCKNLGAKMINIHSAGERRDVIQANEAFIHGQKFRFWLQMQGGKCYRSGPTAKWHKADCNSKGVAGYTFNPLCKKEI